MTIPVSTLPAVKAYLFTQLSARTELADPVGVFYDLPSVTPPDDLVYLGDSRGKNVITRMVGSGGAGWLDEHYELDIVVDVIRGDDDPKANDEQALALLAAVVDTIRADPSLGGLVIQAAPVAFSLSSSWDDDHVGRTATAVLTVDVHARI
jgi:hypothetical protein